MVRRCIASRKFVATARATGGGKALPTCRYAAVFFPWNCQPSSNPWIRAAIRTVKRGIPTKSDSGAESASDFPLTPKVSHARRALVGPKSGPPCFFEPPTRVGAISLARLAQARAPRHPLIDIRSISVSPTVGGSLGVGDGHSKPSLMSSLSATITTLGRS